MSPNIAARSARRASGAQSANSGHPRSTAQHAPRMDRERPWRHPGLSRQPAANRPKPPCEIVLCAGTQEDGPADPIAPPRSACPPTARLTSPDGPSRFSPDIPVISDRSLVAHHKLVGSWVVSKEGRQRLTRPEARRRIEQVFTAKVLDILRSCTIADLRVVLNGESCGARRSPSDRDSVGQLDLRWIEDTPADPPWGAAAAYWALRAHARKRSPGVLL